MVNPCSEQFKKKTIFIKLLILILKKVEMFLFLNSRQIKLKLGLNAYAWFPSYFRTDNLTENFKSTLTHRLSDIHELIHGFITSFYHLLTRSKILKRLVFSVHGFFIYFNIFFPN